MSDFDLNLSRRPFVNEQPVLRSTVLLWCIGALLLVLNVWLFVGHYGGNNEQREELKEVEEGIAKQRAIRSRHEKDLANVDLGKQNVQAAFLNDRIAARRFGWSSLFDDVAATLPGTVRLVQLTPKFGSRSRGRDAGDSADRVRLALRGVAKADEEILVFVDELFEHPRFEEPELSSESVNRGVVEFALEVNYLPAEAAGASEETAVSEPAAGGTDTEIEAALDDEAVAEVGAAAEELTEEPTEELAETNGAQR